MIQPDHFKIPPGTALTRVSGPLTDDFMTLLFLILRAFSTVPVAGLPEEQTFSCFQRNFCQHVR